VSPARSNRALAPLNRGRYVAQFAVVFFAYLVAGKLGQATTNLRSHNLGPVWPAYGVSLAAILLLGYRAWIGVAAGAFLIAYLSPVPALTAAGQAAGATLAAVTGTFLLRRFAHFDLSLTRLRDAIAFILLGALGSAVVSSSIGVTALYASGIRSYSGLGAAWSIYWLGDAMGALLVTPVALTFPSLFHIRDRKRITELAALILFLTAISVMIFGDLPPMPLEARALALAVLPFVMWAAIRFGVSGTSVSVLLIAGIATIETAVGFGPFASDAPLVNATLLDVFFAVLSITGLLLAAAIAEREQSQRDRERLIKKEVALDAFLRAAKRLQESEERLRLAARAGRMYAYEWDVASDVITRSGEAGPLFDPTGKPERLTRQQVAARVHPRDQEIFAAAVSERSPESQDTHITYRLVRPDGSLVWLKESAHASFNAQGKMVRMIGMVADITEQKLAEEARLRHSAVVQSSDDAIIYQDLNGVITSWNTGAQRIFGYSEAEVLGSPITILLSPDLVDEKTMILERLKRGQSLEHYETTRIHKDGKRIEVSLSVLPVTDSTGKVVGFCSIKRDITDRKLADEALADVTRKLVGIEEEERRRIGRDLHDDIGQRVAMLAVEIDRLSNDAPGTAEELHRRLDEVRREITETSKAVSSISHQLHSPQLEYLGVVAAMRSFCREFAEQRRVKIEFTHNDIPQVSSPEVSLCLFRILQEALNNAAKHSNARQFEVKLSCSGNELHMTVTDRGTGFDAEAAMNKGGLGLISMRERVRTVNGTIAIESKLMGGTTIHVRVPYTSERLSERAVGQ
jgi:PAS domain S-box-containing protein